MMPALLLCARRRVPEMAAMGAHVLVSRHRDGRFIGAVVRRYGVGLVHASTSRGGAAGLRTMLRLLAAGDMVGVTPDGPRGPRRVAAPGVAQLAALSGRPVLPCAARSTRQRVLGSWDRMRLPLPFGRGVLVCGPPLTVPRGPVARRRASLADIAAALTAACDAADAWAPERPDERGSVSLAGRAWAGAAAAAAPLLRPYLRRRAERGKEIAARLAERRGEGGERPPGRLLWLHAASVGETLSLLPLLEALADARAGPPLLVTTGTVTAAALLAQRLPPALAARVQHRFAPLDVPRWVDRFLRAGGPMPARWWSRSCGRT